MFTLHLKMFKLRFWWSWPLLVVGLIFYREEAGHVDHRGLS